MASEYKTVSRPTYSCVRCSDRKVRCDKQSPCSACVRHDVQCVFRTHLPSRRKARRVNLKDRLKRYEESLQNLGVDPNGLLNTLETERHRPFSGSKDVVPEDASQLPTPASTVTELERPITTSHLLHGQGRSKLVDNTLWSWVAEEFHSPEDTLEYSSSEASESDEDFSFVLNLARKPKKRFSHPPLEMINQLWQIFTENVDPLTKIVHVPSLQPAIQKAAADLERVPRSFEALMFAVYAAAVVSLKDDECKRRFGEARETLLSYYISATKLALSRAKFMGTNSIVVLQALVLHLFIVRTIYGPRTIWTLTGVAIRIAEGMGLHRDGESLGVPPFETEIRRRIWWQLKMHDFRAAELGGLAKHRGNKPEDGECKAPANVNDNDIYPGMSSPVISSTKPTDMIFTVFRTELASFAGRRAAQFRQQEKDANQLLDDIIARSDQKTKDDFIQEIEEILEVKYLRYCDPSQPLQLLTMLVARSSLNIIRFLTHHPRSWANQEQTSESKRKHVWRISIALLEQHDIVQSDRRLQSFAWYAAYYMNWHVMIHVLDTIRVNPLMPDVEKTWRLVEATYENNPDMIFNIKRPINVAVGNLCLNAFGAYTAAFIRQGWSAPHEPDFITKLRQQREVAKARRKARSRAIGAVVSYTTPPVIDMGTEPPGHSHSNDEVDTDKVQRNSSQGGESDPSSLPSGLHANLYTTPDNVVNMDTDFMLTQDFGLEDVTSQSIDWTQWDAWLSEFDMAHANGNSGSGFQ